ncbi:SDR family oxidoreductase [Blastococcus sp. TF02A-26]|uniref:SDR family oxidoreductase n=1 Tax=Blastococcus sp. TF02A-26 TaxID=2250577 RepID=UPI000DEA2288|nr:SDR family NAD(P)-dependent oxidoreductase [Blastococcus sp. TF02A-26]RBY84326.1 oxidoreductase [Blastococcus sp. TF02A-26]
MDTTRSTVFVTGGTSGIGLGLALRLMAAGSTVVVGGRRTDRLAALAAEHPGLGTQQLDVTDPASIAAAAAAVTAAHPELDTVITTAGIMLPEDLTDPAHVEVAERTVATNLLGTIRSIDAFLPALLRRPAATVMTVSSGLGFVPMPLTPTYSATKAAVHSYTQALRVQLGSTPVQVTELVPPAVRTDLMGQRDSSHAMPLEDYLDEVMALLAERPDADEVLVERVRFLRFAEAEGRTDDVLAQLSRFAA